MVELEAPELSTIFHALGDGTRRRMLHELARGERTVSQLAEPFAMSLAAASKHIKVLENAGLIRREIRWRTHVCRLEPGPLARAHEWLELLRTLLDRPPGRPRTPPPRGGRCEKPRQPRRETTMNDLSTIDAYGVLTEPATLTIQRLLPGPIERIWAYLTESDLRRRWLAAGEMTLRGRRALRARLAQRRAHRPAGHAPRGHGRRAPHGRRASPSSIRRAASPSPGTAAATSPSSSRRRATRSS